VCNLCGDVNNINLKDGFLGNIFMIQVLDQYGQQKMGVISWCSKSDDQLLRKIGRILYPSKTIARQEYPIQLKGIANTSKHNKQPPFQKTSDSQYQNNEKVVPAHAAPL
jgi:hypothetical protein